MVSQRSFIHFQRVFEAISDLGFKRVKVLTYTVTCMNIHTNIDTDKCARAHSFLTKYAVIYVFLILVLSFFFVLPLHISDYSHLSDYHNIGLVVTLSKNGSNSSLNDIINISS